MPQAKRQDFWFYAPFILLAVVATWLVQDHVFFWDTIQLGSKHAHWFYENSFQYLLLPMEIDSGHPPVFGMYLAVCWLLFGKSLLVSHFAMLPFLVANCWLLFQIGKHYAGQLGGLGVLLLSIIDPTLAAQSLLISPDVVLVTFFLLAWWSILQDRKGLLTLAVFGLAMVSMRGMMVGVALFLFEIARAFLLRSTPTIKRFWASLLPYLPGGVFGLLFLTWHYQEAGWIGYHADSPWALSFERVDAAGFVKNVAVFGWRMLDFGRLGIWLVSMIGLVIWWKNRPFQHTKITALLTLLGLLLLLLTPSQLLHKGLLAQRYFLPVFIVLNIVAVYLISRFFTSRKWQMSLFGLAFFSLMTGNFWIYPTHISQGWDATLAHVPHYELRRQMLDFIEQKAIPLEQIGTVFPEIGPLKFKDLSERTDGFITADLEKQDYILYATTMNDFTDDELLQLESWRVVQQFSSGSIHFILYQKPR